MLTFLGFLLVALLAILFLVVVFGLILLGKGIDLVRSFFGLKPRSRFSWNVNVHTGDDRQSRQQTTTRTADGVTIIDRRSQEETQKKIFAPDEGEYVEYTEAHP